VRGTPPPHFSGIHSLLHTQNGCSQETREQGFCLGAESTWFRAPAPAPLHRCQGHERQSGCLTWTACANRCLNQNPSEEGSDAWKSVVNRRGGACPCSASDFPRRTCLASPPAVAHGPRVDAKSRSPFGLAPSCSCLKRERELGFERHGSVGSKAEPLNLFEVGPASCSCRFQLQREGRGGGAIPAPASKDLSPARTTQTRLQTALVRV